MTDHRIRMQSGALVDPWDLTPADLLITDIAHSLSRVCRFGGHTSGFLSVARHSIRVAEALQEDGYSRQIALQGLLHDASEAYLGDIPSPLKNRPQFRAFRKAEARAHLVIAETFGGVYPHPPEVHAEDRRQLFLDFDRRNDPDEHYDPYGDAVDFLNLYHQLRPAPPTESDFR